MVARDLAEFLWVLADGLGPMEAADQYETGLVTRPNPELTAVAQQYAPDRRRPATDLVELARSEFPDFDETIMALCR